VRVLYFFEQDTESFDPSVVRFFIVGQPPIGPGEDRDAPFEKFFGGWPMAVNGLVGTDPGECPEHVGEREAPEKHGDNKQKQYDFHVRYPFTEVVNVTERLCGSCFRWPCVCPARSDGCISGCW